MAESADIGANFSNYQGSAPLGGSSLGVINIDTKPLDSLALYTTMYNKSVWEQNQKETDAKIAKLADLSTIALNNLRGKDKEQAAKEFSELQNYATEYARKTPRNAQEKMQNELEWQTKYGAFKNNYNSGKDRAITYQKRYNAIMNDANKDSATKNAELAILNREFDNSGIDTKISGVQNFKTEQFDIPAPVLQKFNSIILGANGNNDNIDVEGVVFNPKLNSGVVDATLFNINKVSTPNKNTPEYQKLSQVEKDELDVQATVRGNGKGWADATTPLNEAIKKYINPQSGVFDAARFENDNAANTTLMNAYNALKNLDTYSRTKYDQASKGFFNDNGVNVPIPQTLNPEDFKVGYVDFSKGVTPSQLLQAGSFAKYLGDNFGKKVQHTGEGEALKRAKINEQGANYRANLAALNKKGDSGLAASGIINEIADIINEGDRPENQVTVVDENNVTRKVFKIGDPNILQKFGNVDKLGNLTNVPDEARFDPKTNEIDLVYFSEAGGPAKKNASGGNFITKQTKLNARTWANMVSQRTFSGQDRGDVNEIVQKVITDNGGDLYKVAKALNRNKSTVTESVSIEVPTLTTKAEFDALPKGAFYYRGGKKYQK